MSDDDATYENTPNNDNMHTLRLGSTKSKLYIDCVAPSEAGEYVCVAETPYQRVATATKLLIGKHGCYLYIIIYNSIYNFTFYIINCII